MGDILKVHDFNYIMRVMQQVETLSGSDNKILKHFDG